MPLVAEKADRLIAMSRVQCEGAPKRAEAREIMKSPCTGDATGEKVNGSW